MSRKFRFLIIFLVITLSVFSQKHLHPEGVKVPENLKTVVRQDLIENILPFWMKYMTDSVNEGFYGRIDGNNRVYPEAVKGGILNARILWTFSSAFRVTHDEQYLRMAERAKDYIIKYFIDRDSGGAWYSLNADGTPSDTRKQVYTNAFFIYALSEYSRATGDISAADEAMKIFDQIEKHALDKENGGYFEVFSHDWIRLNDRLIGESSSKDEKTMNTHLHLLEAYANLYRLTGDRRTGERLRDLIMIFLERIIDSKTSHLICFMDRQWNRTSTVDSYGHDIEASWLLYEAASILNDDIILPVVREASVNIADAAAEGYQAEGSMLTEKDYVTGHVRKQRSWWEQAETVIGYLNAFELTGNEIYLKRSTDTWEYIKRNFIDSKNGGWFSYISEEGNPSGDKGGFWICPYHNGRMCMEVIERAGD